MVTVLKLGGELLGSWDAMRLMAAAVRSLAAEEQLIVVHGGGRAIDADLRARGMEPRFVDGLRITDDATLESVVAVLAGRTNTAFVGALHASGVKAVGLTGADDGIGSAQPAPPFISTTGEKIALGRVGVPHAGSMVLVRDLLTTGYVPVIASIGVEPNGRLLNINADTFAGQIAVALGADRLLIAGGTAGVLDEAGATIATMTDTDIGRMIGSGAAHSGMVAKLTACRGALDGGVTGVAIIGGKGLTNFRDGSGTTIVRSHVEMGIR